MKYGAVPASENTLKEAGMFLKDVQRESNKFS
jgi:hypothetical protein